MKTTLVLACLFAAPLLAGDAEDFDAGMKSGEAALNDGRYKEAIAAFQKTEGLAQAFGLGDERHIHALNRLTYAQNTKGDAVVAEGNAKKALELAQKNLGPEAAETGRALNNLGDALSGQDKNTEAEPFYQKSYDVLSKALGKEHPDTAEALANIGVMCNRAKKYRDAEKDLREAEAVFEKAGDVWRASVCLASLAYLHNDQGLQAQLEKEYRVVLQMREKALRADHPLIGQALSDLSTVIPPERTDESVALLKRALDIAEKSDPEGSPLGFALFNLAVLYHSQQKFGDAEPLYKRALAVWEKALGPNNANVATCLENYATLMENTNRQDEAAPLKARVQEIRNRPASSPAEAWDQTMQAGKKAMDENRFGDAVDTYRKAADQAQSFGERDERAIRTQVQLALALRNKPDYPEAESTARKTLSTAEAALGPNALEVADVLNTLALILDDLDKSAESEPLYERALAIRMKALGADSPDVGVSLNNLGMIFLREQKYPEAEKLFKKAVAIAEKNKDTAYLAFTLNNLGQAHEDMKQTEEAERDYRKSLDLYEHLSFQDPNLANVCFNLGNLMRKKGRIDETLELLKRAADVTEKTLGPEHPQMAKALHNRAVVLMGQGGHVDEADGLFRHSRAIWEKAYGPDHPEVASSLDNHARLLDGLPGREQEVAEMRRRVQEIRAKRR